MRWWPTRSEHGKHRTIVIYELAPVVGILFSRHEARARLMVVIGIVLALCPLPADSADTRGDRQSPLRRPTGFVRSSRAGEAPRRAEVRT